MRKGFVIFSARLGASPRPSLHSRDGERRNEDVVGVKESSLDFETMTQTARNETGDKSIKVHSCHYCKIRLSN